ncbi:molybdopterin-dependent oxidoreductase [Lunatimonas salinarum]|uniref:molybdopterin-dependent oxidoreductase n=1 Tax=Lunatimonas salinarum TaxID=1774590 RepID=UPI001FD7B413|nr:molybdopterin-dependent oxidoreductase [Lunatimonas salinarum]
MNKQLKASAWWLLPISMLMLIPSKAAFVQQSGAVVIVGGEVQTPLSLRIEDLSTFEKFTHTTTERNGTEAIYTGVALVDVLYRAGVSLGGDLRGENLVKYLIAKARDGYEVLFSLPEIDPEFTNERILLVYELNGQPLPAGTGPFRLVVPQDKRSARWIRELVSLEVRFAPAN